MPEFEEAQVRVSIFLGLFLILAILQYYAPRRVPRADTKMRWFTNWAIAIIDSVVLRFLFASAAVGAALWAQQNNYGLFNLSNTSGWVTGIISFIVLDFAIWLSHVASHKIPIFWKVHRMHHSDVDFDVTTAIRFHPIEIVLSMLWKFAIVIAIGAPPISVLLFEIILNGTAMFNHSNLKLNLAFDRWLRIFVVTPDMHRVHHSIIHNETDSNYGFNLAIWDRIFGTYIDQPEAGHDDMIIGLDDWQDERPTKLIWSLCVPFISKSTQNKPSGK